MAEAALGIAGAAIGAASLAIQITDECIKKYHYLVEAGRMPESFQYLQVRLQMEQQRFLSFALEAGLLFADGQLCATLQVNQAVLERVLYQIKTAMEAFDKMQEKYSTSVPHIEPVDWDNHGEPRIDLMDLLRAHLQDDSAKGLDEESTLRDGFRPRSLISVGRRVTRKARKLRVILTDPKRFSWASVDQASLGALISRLESLNSYLISLLDASQIARLDRRVESSYLEMLQLRNDLKELKVLIQALAPYSDSNSSDSATLGSGKDEITEGSSGEEIPNHAQNKQFLKKLATIKIDRMGVDVAAQPLGDPDKDEPDPKLDISSDFDTHALDKEAAAEFSGERQVFTWKGRQVWVEWIGSPASRWLKAEESQTTERRVALLANLLRKGLPASFRAPPCEGYVKSHINQGSGDDRCAFGLVFEQPATTHCDTALVTLRQLLVRKPKPSLSKRMALASSLSECVQSFHCVAWLHKGLRSDNIIFFRENAAVADLSRPYVTGFELSRPADKGDLTEKPELNYLQDLYRHPRAQGGEGGGPYRQCYDLYSLGILLLEIIYWRPIEDILQLQPPIVKYGLVRRVKDQLLGQDKDDTGHDDTMEKSSASKTPAPSKYLDKAAERGGDVYRDIVELCLAADKIERPVYRHEPKTAIDQRLHVAFDEQVVLRLQSMKQALEAPP